MTYTFIGVKLWQRARSLIFVRKAAQYRSACSYDLVDAARAVHDLFHLRLCLQIIGRWIKLAPKSVRGAIQIVHSVFEIVFCLLGLVPPRLSVS